jgi:hypothetical protein
MRRSFHGAGTGIAASAKIPDVLARLFPVGHMTAISRVLSR